MMGLIGQNRELLLLVKAMILSKSNIWITRYWRRFYRIQSPSGSIDTMNTYDGVTVNDDREI